MPDRMRKYQQKVQLAAQEAMEGREPLTGPLRLELSPLRVLVVRLVFVAGRNSRIKARRNTLPICANLLDEPHSGIHRLVRLELFKLHR